MYATEAENKDANLFNCVQVHWFLFLNQIILFWNVIDFVDSYLVGAERAPEFIGNDAYVLYVDDSGGN